MNSGAGSVTRDSAGVRIVENTRPMMDSLTWHVDSQPQFVLGGPGDSLFFRVNDSRYLAAVGLTGARSAILDPLNSRVLIVDSSGRPVRSIGRRGEGPGEFLKPVALQNLGGDILLVWDVGFGPRTRIDTMGRILDITHIDLTRVNAAIGTEGWSEQMTPLSGGAFLAHVLSRVVAPQPPYQVYRDPMQFVVMSPDSDPARLTGFHDASVVNIKEGSASRRIPAPFLSTYTVAAGGTPTRLFMADGEPYAISVFDDRGALLRSIRRIDPMPGFSAEQVARSRESSLGRARTPEIRREMTQVWDALKAPSASIIAMVVDDGGNLWVRSSLGGWSVFDSEGRWLTQLRVGPVQRVLAVGTDYIIATELDEDGGLRIVRRRLSRSAS